MENSPRKAAAASRLHFFIFRSLTQTAFGSLPENKKAEVILRLFL
jgi:hypothetical protein